MPVDWSRKRRERAAEYLALAENTSDMRVRTALLAMAQRWLEVSNETLEAAQQDVWDRSYYHVLMRSQIGSGLRGLFELSQELPERMHTLLAQLDK
jgi:hypothetical protein